MAAPIRVAILDDHQPTVDGYIARLKLTPQIEVVGTAAFGVELAPLLASHPADILVLDVSVPMEADNRSPYPVLHVIPELLQTYPALRILVSSMHTERTLIKAILDAGASGYIFKDDGPAQRELGAIVASLATGSIYLSQRAHQQLQSPQSKSNEPLLTRRQLEVLSLCAANPSATEAHLATQLGVRNSTVRNLLSSAYLRLGVPNRATAVAKARELGLITPLPPAAPT